MTKSYKFSYAMLLSRAPTLEALNNIKADCDRTKLTSSGTRKAWDRIYRAKKIELIRRGFE